MFGHLSNERRVSKTVNQWEWEQERPRRDEGRVNSQRHQPPSLSSPLPARGKKGFVNSIKSVGAWAAELDKGPAHLEWAWTDNRLLLLQLDFEDDGPDHGQNPFDWQRQGDHRPTRPPLEGSAFTPIPKSGPTSPWKKIEKTKLYAAVRSECFPNLFTITGDRLSAELSAGSDLESQLEAIADGRVVCRTDVDKPGFPRTNLPRTHTVNSAGAVTAMQEYITQLHAKGVAQQDICFLLHKFIPAGAAAWAKADPSSQIVRVDGLWGVPDGLQYLPHDTFEYDVVNKSLTGERIRYKPRFVQEVETGEWKSLRVGRPYVRRRSLKTSDVREVAEVSLELARRENAPLLVMWFCSIPTEIGIGRNLPWFSMAPNAGSLLKDGADPEHLRRWPRRVVRSRTDLEAIAQEQPIQIIMTLDPEVNYIRDDEGFLKRAVEVAKERKLVIELAGSILSHAYFELERSGIPILLADEADYSRTRRRQDYRKLVREKVPNKIETKGEAVVQTTLPRSELRRALVAKLFEEGQEVLAAREPQDVREEIADLLEVIRGIAAVTGVEWEAVEEAARAKHEERGGFEGGRVLVETSYPSLNRPNRRPASVLSLRQLGRVVEEEDAVQLSFNALVAAGSDGTRVRLGSMMAVVAISSEGVGIRIDTEQSPSASQQLTLPFLE